MEAFVPKRDGVEVAEVVAAAGAAADTEGVVVAADSGLEVMPKREPPVVAEVDASAGFASKGD